MRPRVSRCLRSSLFGALAGAVGTAAATLTPVGPAVAAPCPASTVGSGGTIVYYSSTATIDSYSNGVGAGSWDSAAGTAYMYSAGSLGGLSLNVYDDFDVTGVPAGTPVTLTAELTIDGAVWTAGCGGSGCGGIYSVRIFHGTDSLGVSHNVHLFSGREDFHDEIELPLSIVAGQPERLRVWAEGRRTPGGSHESEANCVLRFKGASVGVTVTSCKGFQLVPTPTVTRNWGSLKLLYR